MMMRKVAAPSKASSAAAAAAAAQNELEREKWVQVSWMQHTNLSQTSHICLMIRSATVNFGRILFASEESQEWCVRVSIFGLDGLALLPISGTTVGSPVKRINAASQPFVSNATHDCRWDYLVNLPVRWRDLPRDAYLFFEVLGMDESVVYRATMPFFSRYGKMATGLMRIQLRTEPLDTDNRNYGLVDMNEDESKDSIDDPVWKAVKDINSIQEAEAGLRSAGPRARRKFGQPQCVPWLDALTKQQAINVIKDHMKEADVSTRILSDETASLIIELPTFELPIMHEETFYQLPQHGGSGSATPIDLVTYRTSRKPVDAALDVPIDGPQSFRGLDLITFLDYENEDDNPYEDKYRTLAHDLLRGMVDPDLKPDKEQRSKLEKIIDAPSHHPTREERDLLWRFRFSLVDNRRALTKFLVAVDWSVESEVVQAAELLEQWRRRSPIEVTDALKLLGKHVAFQTNVVRDYAIDTLAAAPDSELRLYLLQLVQALKYENSAAVETGTRSSAPSPSNVSPLSSFLINRAAGSMQLANYLYWYLKVEFGDPTHGSKYKLVFEALKLKLSKVPFSMSAFADTPPPEEPSTSLRSVLDSVSKLSSSFIKHTDSPGGTSRTKKALQPRSLWDVLEEQDQFITGLLDVQLRCREARGKRDIKEKELRSLLDSEGYGKKAGRGPIPLPSTPEIFVNGVRPENATMFKSALYPALLDFHVEGTVKAVPVDLSEPPNDYASALPKPRRNVVQERLTSCKVIVKTGDDLRQDQLVIMMIQLMDRLLKRAALDLCLTPYSIIATSHNTGLVEFVDKATPISAVLSQYNGSILQYLREKSPRKGEKYDVAPEALDAYIRSCAGYCVITYILGVGDRHLDNIMLRSTGHFFHIDFGFIFGRDPKPLPPAFRLTREMVDGMGGIDSAEYRHFCSLACQAYKALRKSAGLILNLLHLMSDANIDDLSNNPSADAEGVLAKTEERFRLDLSDEEADKFFNGLISDSLAAIAPRVMDVFHSIAVARR